ncbi:MAG: alpha-amylase [Planctomycetota bacterium]
MTTVVLFLEFHQPFRLRRFNYLDVGGGDSSGWFDAELDREVLERVVERCYLPVCSLFERLASRHGAAFEVAASFTGTLLDQLEAHAPEALERLAALERLEVLCETSHHSLASLFDRGEFEFQVESHRARLEALFGRAPTAFRNTELIADVALIEAVDALGFEALLVEGADRLLGRRPLGQVWTVGARQRLRALPRHYRLSDDLAFRFSDRGWSEYPLDPQTWVDWIRRVPGEHPVIGLYMDVETFGEHQPAESGIFDFLETALDLLATRDGIRLAGPTAAAAAATPAGQLDFDRPVSWADTGRDLSAWLGGPMQRAAFEAHRRLGDRVRALETERPDLLRDWRRLSTSDHFYYMSTADGSDGDVHAYFRPFPTAHAAHIAFMNVLEDLKRQLGSARSGVS